MSLMIMENTPQQEKRKTIDVISIVFLFFSFFPYLKVVETGSDLQPLSFLIGLLYLVIKWNRVMLHKQIYLILITLIFVVIFFFIGVLMQYDIVLVRALYSYISIFIHSFVAYDIIRRKKAFLSVAVEWAIYVWFFVGFIQNYLNPGFLTFLLSRGFGYDGDIGGRGVISLAVEPTFYGIHCFFFFLFVLLLKRTTQLYSKRKANLLFALCLIQIVLFARSSMVMLFLLLIVATLLFIYLFKKPLYALLSIIVIVTLFNMLFSIMNHDSRIYSVASMILKSPGEILMMDRSINERVSDIYYSIKGFVSNPLGYGLNGWQAYLLQLPESNVFAKTEQARIMSFLGAFLFEMGVFSFFLIFYIYRGVKCFLKGVNGLNIIWYLIVFLILLTAIQSSYPPLWILLSSSFILAKQLNKTTVINR